MQKGGGKFKITQQTMSHFQKSSKTVEREYGFTG